MPWAYILRCRDGSYYVGSTVDLDRRVSQHQLGEGAAYTRTRRPVELVWAAEFGRIDEAFAFEKRVQGWGRRKREALIAGWFDALPGLASRSWGDRRARGELPGSSWCAEVGDRLPGFRDGCCATSSTTGGAASTVDVGPGRGMRFTP